MVLELDVTKSKDDLKGLLSLNPKWLFRQNYIYVVNPLKTCFARLHVPELESEEPANALFDMEKLDSVLSRKTVTRVKIMMAGYILVEKPFQMEIPVSREDNPEEIKEIMAWERLCSTIEEAEDEFQDARGNIRAVAHFEADSEEFGDFLEAAGFLSDTLVIRTGNSITAQVREDTGKLGTRVRYSKVNTEKEVEVILSVDNQSSLNYAIAGDKTQVSIVDKVYCLMSSDRLTVLGGGMVE